MKTPFASSSSLSAAPPRRRRSAFSLVEVTLALGIVTFGLVGVVGVLPAALASGRQSFDQNRAAAIASTLFASFRSQPFSKVCYVDAQFSQTDGSTATGAGPAPVDLNQPTAVTFYAKFLNAATDAGDSSDTFGSQRRLSFTSAQPAGGADYKIALNFNDQTASDGTSVPANKPDGMVTTGQACRLEVVISPISRPSSVYRFVSTVASRSSN